MVDTTELTDDQIDFLVQCEADFANRYTDKDDDFSIVMAIGTSRPPIMEPWRPKGGNSYRPDRSARERERFRERNYKRKHDDDYPKRKHDDDYPKRKHDDDYPKRKRDDDDYPPYQKRRYN